MHSDVAGPINTVSWRGGKYFCTLLDDFREFVKVGVLADKGQAGRWVMRTLTRWEVETQQRVVRVHTDQGGEYTGRELRAARVV